MNKQEQKHVKVIFSNTYDLDAYHYALVSEEEFQRLEALRDGKMWVWVGWCWVQAMFCVRSV